MITHAKVFQPEAHPSIMTGAFAALTKDVGQSLPTSFILPAANYSIVSSKSVCSVALNTLSFARSP